MTEEEVPTIDTNLFGSTSSDAPKEDDWTLNIKEPVPKDRQTTEEFKEKIASSMEKYSQPSQQTGIRTDTIAAPGLTPKIRSKFRAISSTTTEPLCVDRWLPDNTW